MSETGELTTRPPERPRFYGRRRGKALRRGAQSLMELLLPRLAIATPGQDVVLDPPNMFPGEVSEVWLEVGFGGGEHLAAQAQSHAGVGLIGCEPFRNGIASLLSHIHSKAIDNIRVFPEDARLLFPALPEASIGRAFVLFPDPWPKKRHAERRFVCAENLDALARVLKDGAELRVASDDPVYQDWAAEQLDAHKLFEKVLVTDDRAALPADWAPTRYEEKCLAGNPPKFFLYRRLAR